MFCCDTVPFIGSNREEPFDSTEEDIHLMRAPSMVEGGMSKI
jgi:hypothetical protein